MRFPIRPAVLFLLMLPAISWSRTAKREGQTISGTEAAADLIYHPLPAYPLEARRTGEQGNGKYLVVFDRGTGAVRSVTIVHSTGSKLLDNTMVGAIRTWRAKPHTLDKAYIPVAFAIASENEQKTLRQADPNVLYSPYPKYPLSVRWEYPSGRGLFQLQIDQQSGLVSSVHVVRTMGDNRVDAATIATLRQWRFRPHTLKQLVVPIEF